MKFNVVQTETGSEPIVVEYYFAAAPAQVYQAWTDPNIVVKWFGHAPNSLHSATIDLRPGGAWQFLESSDERKSVGFEGEFLDIQYGERLVFTWSRFIAHANGEREAMLHAEVEVNFTAKGSGTDVRLVHTVKRPDDSRRGIDDGWQEAFNAMDALFIGSESGS